MNNVFITVSICFEENIDEEFGGYINVSHIIAVVEKTGDHSLIYTVENKKPFLVRGNINVTMYKINTALSGASANE